MIGRGKRALGDLDRDIGEHIAMETEDNIARGMPPEEARYAALRKFGNVTRVKEETRAVWKHIWLDQLLQDLRFGLRMLRQSPGFSAIAILTLALGIGANTAIFSLIDTVMLRALPVEKPSQLVLVRWNARNPPNIHGYMSSGDCTSDLGFGIRNPSGCSFSEPMYDELKKGGVFSGTAAFANSGRLSLTGNGAATVISGQLVSGDFFPTLGLKAAAGRLIDPHDDTPSSAPVAVLNYGYWQSAFGGSAAAVGRTIELNQVPFTIIGVAEPRFTGVTPGSDYDVWIPLANDRRISTSNPIMRIDRRTDPASWWLTVLGRLKPDVPLPQAQAVLSGIFRNQTLHGSVPLFHSGEPEAKSKPAPPPGGMPAARAAQGRGPRPKAGARKRPLRKLAPETSQAASPPKPMMTPMPLSGPRPIMPAGAHSANGGPQATPQADNPEITLVPAQSGLSGSRTLYSNPLYTLMLAVGLILLIACANLAGLMLARAAKRQREMAVRQALGAGRIRILRQLLTESMLLAVLGGLLGVCFAYWGAHVIVSFIAHNQPGPFGFAAGVDLRVLGFTIVISVLSGILFGAAPALRSIHGDVAPALKQGEGSSLTAGQGKKRFSTGNLLVAAQMALAMILLVGAGLLVRTLQNLRSVDIGFDSHNLLMFGIDPTLAGYKGAQVDSIYRDLQSRLAEIPGVKSASYSMGPLLSGGLMVTGFHWPGTPADQESQADTLGVGPDFFQTLHIPFIAGRDFLTPDFEVAERNVQAMLAALNGGKQSAIPARTPVIVNQAFVKKYLGKENPLGKQFGEWAGDAYRPASPGYEIIGVVRDTKYSDLRRDIQAMMFTPQALGGASFQLRTAADPQGILAAARRAVAQVNASLPLYNVQTESEQIDRLLFQERLVARLAGFFASLALVLACIGLYGLLSYEVARRTREIGIRMALGAQSGDVLRLVMKQGATLALIGAATGIAVAAGVTRYLSSMLYNVRARDPFTLIAVAALLVLVALAACYFPARRALRVDPMVALRCE